MTRTLQEIIAQAKNALCCDRIVERNQACQRGEVSEEWKDGWVRAFGHACLDALDAAPDPENWLHLSVDKTEPLRTGQGERTEITFRKATLRVADPDKFVEGIRFGLAAQVDDEAPLTATHLFRVLVESLVKRPSDHTPTDWLIGYLLGRVDALLHARRYHPNGWRGEDEWLA